MSFGIMDIIVIAILLLSVLIGIKLGFIEKFFRLVRKFAAFLISFFLAKPASVFLSKNTGLDETINGKIVGWLVEKSNLFAQPIPDDKTQMIEQAFDALKIPSFLANPLKDKVEKLVTSIPDNINTVGELFSSPLTSLIMIIIAFVSLFILSLIVVFILKKIFKALAKNRLIGGLDRLLGAGLGFVEGALIIILIMFGLSFVINGSFLPSVSDWLIKDMKLAESDFSIAKWIYNQHLFMKLFELIWK